MEVDSFVELHYLEKGEGDPIIFIPGLTFSGKIFKAQIEYFSKKYRAIAIDPRGQGLSGKGTYGNDYQTHGKDIYAFVNKLNLRNIAFVGWSTGNLDIWSYVEQFGMDSVKNIVTIDMSPLPMSTDPTGWVEGSVDELRGATQELNTPKGVRDFFTTYTTEIMIEREVKGEELEYLLDISAKTPYQICHSLFANAITSDYFETAAEISRSETPSLMFIAKHWADIAEPFMQHNFPGTKTHVMGGHFMFYEYPEEWNKVLEGFLNN